MSRLSRINTIWRKELTDTLRDRRTLVAMILVPIVLYPVLMLTSLQGVELQQSRVRQETFHIVVQSEEVRTWLRWLLDTDPARHQGLAGLTAEELKALADQGTIGTPADDVPPSEETESARKSGWEESYLNPPKFEIHVEPNFERLALLVRAGQMNAGLLVDGQLPQAAGDASVSVTLIMDQTEFRSRDFAAPALRGVLDRYARTLLASRLRTSGLPDTYVQPLAIDQQSVATPEKVGGSILGTIVPLILIVMTITGAIYPAIDLTAGERERGTLETLMVAPVPTVDLIAGKFVVVALIGMLSAVLNLLSIGGTIYLGGLGTVLGQGDAVQIPYSALPLVLLVLMPLAVMFSAALLAVCSFARSFKEAQNYVMPVMIAALIPAVIGILPGTQLDGPMLVMPVANIVVLTRDLFTGKFDPTAIIWVSVTTTLYAGAAVAVAARLFGQEAVLFADSGSVKTLFQRRFFQPRSRPTTAQAFLLLAVCFSLNFFAQRQFLGDPESFGTTQYWITFAAILLVVFIGLPLAAAAYMRVEIRPAFNLRPPPISGMLAALAFGLSTWILAAAWYAFQSTWLPMPAEMAAEFGRVSERVLGMHPLTALLCFALLPAVCEEFFFRGYALSGLRGGIGKVAAVLIVAIAFGINHHSIFRLLITAGLGVLFGVLVLRFGSLWPAILAHLMHNGLTVLAGSDRALKPFVERLGYAAEGAPPLAWILGALALLTCGVLIVLFEPARHDPLDSPAAIRQDER